MLELKRLSIALDGVGVVHDSFFKVEKGKITALIGESGSGKSLTVASILRLLPKNAQVEGEIMYKGTNLLAIADEDMVKLRRESIFTVLQDASNSFNEHIKMERQLFAFSAGRIGDDWQTFERKMTRILEGVRLSPAILQHYPFELSGGMLQRCMIACAMYVQPELLIADEPTSALDAIVQKEFLGWLRTLNENGTTVLLITHDLDSVADVADALVVMQHGRVVEQGFVKSLFTNPVHAYTKRLIDSRF